MAALIADTHCHLTDGAFSADLELVLERCWGAGLGLLVVIGPSRPDAVKALELARRDRRIYATAGIHPHEASSWNADTAGWLSQFLADPRVVAAGETGLDYHYDHSPRERQREAFDAQLGLARAAGKPAVIHARDADEDVAAVLGNHPDTAAILHSFSSGRSLLEAGLSLGHYVSFSGMVTFRNWTMDDAIRRVPMDRLLLETDSPYLAPAPHRGKRNEPANVVNTARRIAEVRGVEYDELCHMTTANAMRAFNLLEVP